MVQAQIKIPSQSPSSTFTQRVGLTDISVEYSRPSMKGRVIYGDLVPFEKIWRTGANAVTNITFSDDVEVGGITLEAGRYAILSKPGKDIWEFYFYAFDKRGWGGYREKTPEITLKISPENLPYTLETFTIDINNLQYDAADLRFTWEKTQLIIPVKVNFDAEVMADIEEVMAGPSRDDYFRAATYYHEHGKDLKKALEFVNKALNGAEKQRFWQVYRKALILADLGMPKEAVETAKLSLRLAKEAKNDDYVRLNEIIIAKWAKK